MGGEVEKVAWSLDERAAVGPQLHAAVRSRIVRGNLTPGSKLSEADIATAYNISRQPVREAFIKLAEEGLLEVRPQRGTYVSLISVPAVTTARFIREAVESDIVRLVAGTASEADLLMLEDEIAKQKAMAADAPAEDFILLDERFHGTLAKLAGQAAVADHLLELNNHLNRVRHISARQFSREKSVVQHAAIVQAIRARDPDRAEKTMRDHLREIIADLPSIVGAAPDFFRSN